MKLSNGWALSLLWREAVKNTLWLTSRLFPYVVSAAVMAVFVTIVLASQSAIFQVSLSEAREQGRNIYRVEAASPDREVRISRSSCEALNSFRTVVAAGLIEPLSRADVIPIGTQIAVVAASTALVPELNRAPAVVGSALRSTNLTGAIEIDGTAVVAVLGARKPAGIDVNSAITTRLTPDQSDGTSCLIEFDRFASAPDVAAALSSLQSEGGALVANPVRTETVSLVDAHLSSIINWLPVVGGLAGGLVTALAIRARRGELAAYYYAGSSPNEVALLVSFECIVVGGTACFFGVLASAILGLVSLSPTSLVLSALALATTWTAVAMATSIPVAFNSAHRLGKRR